MFNFRPADRAGSPPVQPDSSHHGTSKPTRAAGLEHVCCAPFQRHKRACAGPSLSVRTPRRTPVSVQPATGATATRRVGTEPPRRKCRHRHTRAVAPVSHHGPVSRGSRGTVSRWCRLGRHVVAEPTQSQSHRYRTPGRACPWPRATRGRYAGPWRELNADVQLSSGRSHRVATGAARQLASRNL
jgi:hypothetical protein